MTMKTTKKITRDLAGLRDAGFDTLEAFMAGHIGTEHVDAVNATIRTICLTIVMEQKADDALRSLPGSMSLPKLPG